MISSILASSLLLNFNPPKETVKVFVLVGQSNMQGHGFIAADPDRNEGRGSLEYIAQSATGNQKIKSLLLKDGTWQVRDDVWIDYFERKGKLSVGYGVGDDCIGPELGFGNFIGNSFKEPVFLIKIAWGGRSLAVDFRPPSSGGSVGQSYTEVVSLVGESLANLSKNFPELSKYTPQLAGFGWHQGWNDRIDENHVREYEKNMINLIKDIRKDLKAPNLPVVIAETGMGGMEESDQQALDLMKAQAAVAKQPDLKNSVAFVGTRSFWRSASESPTDAGYHWNNNAETYFLIGDSMGEAMINLIKRGRK